MYTCRHFWGVCISLYLVGILGISQHPTLVSTANASTRTAVTLPDTDGSIIFEPNRGQAGDAVHFVAQGEDYTLWLVGENEARFALASSDGTVQQVSMVLVNSQASPVIRSQKQITGTSHYLIGSDPAAWVTQVPHYEQVRYEAVYPGIDVIYQGYGGQLQYNFVITPGADPGLLWLAFDPVEEIELLANGDLLLHLPGGTLRQHAPIAYQEVDGHRIEVASRFVINANHQVGFAFGSYDSTLPLVIDPILEYGSYLGGSSNSDYPVDIAVDDSGAMYVTGYTSSKDFPITSGAPGTNEPSTTIPWAFVTKFNPDGSLAYSTYLAGTTKESRGASIAVDPLGYATVVGYTKSSTFPTTPGAYDTTFNTSAESDAFVTRLTPDGARLVFSTYLGGESGDSVSAVTVGTDASIYVAGVTASPTFPTTPDVYGPVMTGGGRCICHKIYARWQSEYQYLFWWRSTGYGPMYRPCSGL